MHDVTLRQRLSPNFNRAVSWAACLAVVFLLVPRGQAAPACFPAPTGLVGWWRGDGSFGDSTGTNNGTVEGAVGFAAGEVGQAFQFAGHGNSVVIPNAPAQQLSTQFTIEAWVNPATATDDSYGPGRGIVSKVGGPGGNHGYQFATGQNRLSGAFSSAGGGWPTYSVSAPTASVLPVGVWSHVAFTYDNNAMMLFINGQPVATNVIGAHAVESSSSNLRISGDDNGNVYYDGLIDEVSLYTNALTAAQIQAIYLADAAGKCHCSTVSDFAASDDGWKILEFNNPNTGNYTVTYAAAGVTYVSSGGNPGGYIHRTDPSSSPAYLQAPAKFTGNQLQLYGGWLSFDYRDVLASGTSYPTNIDVILMGNGQHLVANLGLLGNQPWLHYTIGLNETAGWHKETLAGAAPTLAEFVGVLSGLSGAYVYADLFSGTDDTWLDNFAMSCPLMASVPPYVTRDPAGAGGYVGGNYSFTVSAAGTPPLSYQWRKGGSILSGATNTVLNLTNVQPAAAGSYDVVVTNFFGAVTSLVAVLTVDSVVPVPPPPGLIGWWPAEGNANDVLGLHNGTLVGNVMFSSGAVGESFIFDGTNSYAQVPDAPELSPHVGPNGELSLEAWVRIARLPKWDTATGQPYRAVAVKGSPSNWEYGLFLGTNGVPYFQLWTTSGGGYSGATGPALSLNQWHHLVGVMRKGQFTRLYVDGQLAGESASFSSDTGDGAAPLYIGRRGDGQWLDGQVDEVSLYGRALSAAEISGLYGAGAGGKSPRIAGAAVPYFTDFETGAGPEWMLPQTDNTESLGFTRFSGRLGNSSQMLTLTNLVVGQSYTLGFDLYIIDSWDPSSDLFNVEINGVRVFQQNFANSGTQGYPGVPDEGRFNMGFTPGYLDAIYRNLEISFLASNALTEITFSGQGLEAIDNESWGLDNVSVRSTADLTNTFVRSTTLPLPGSTNSIALENFTISANWPLLANTATNPANFSLKEAGIDGTFGTGDDVGVALTVSLPGAGGRSVAFALVNPPLQPGHYRFQTTTGLQGTNGAAVPVFTRDFYIVNPVLGNLETPGNDAIANASPLPTTESPVGSGFFTAFAVGTFSSTSDVDYWRFDAEAGDRITIRLESESQGVNPHLRLRNSSDSDLSGGATDGGSDGVAQLQNVTIPTPGTYYVRVWSANNRSRYWLRLDQSRAPQMESENNDSQGNADAVNLTFSPGLYQGRMVGSLPAGDTAGDFFQLGVLNSGNAISVSTLYPTGSTLTASQTILSIQLDGNAVALVTNLTGTLNFTTPSNGVHYLHIESTNRTLRAQYLLAISISDGVPPVVTDASLPAEGTTATAIIDRFSASFSEDLMPSSVSNAANYELRCAGADGVLGTADDSLYSVATTGYSSGLSAAYTILDGPLQVGKYRFTATGLTDRANNHMLTPYVRTFTVANLPGYVLENRYNDVGGAGTPLSPALGTNGDGTISWLASYAVGTNPEGITAGYIGTDTNLDIVTGNYGAGTITILTNNGQGAFQTLTNLATGSGAVWPQLADFNGDGLNDIAVANYSAGTVTILLGNANGTFQLATNIGGFSSPYHFVAVDLNGDGHPDLAVPNYGASSIAVLLGNGDGSFQLRSNYTTGNNPMTIAAGDLNGDSKPDLAVANYGSATVSLLTNAGNGTFLLATNLPTGPNPRCVAIADVTGDGIPDLVVLQYGNATIGVFAGVGNGTFQARRDYSTGTDNAYHMLVTDLNGDGRPDVVVPGYGNNVISILLNNGGGVFTNLYTYGQSANPIGVVAGDFNHDGRTELAFSCYNGPYVYLWAVNPACAPSQDPPGSGVRTLAARGTRSNSSDADYYRFSGNAGDQVELAVENVPNASYTGLNYYIMTPDGSGLTSFNADYRGWGQSGVVTLPQTGTYLVRVAGNYDYQGEYRFRLTIIPPPMQFETEDNSSQSAADVVSLTRTNNHLQAAMAGYLGVYESADWYNLGNLVGGAVINIGVREPASSGLAEILWLYNAAGTLMTNSAAGATNFTFTVPIGQDGTYYVQVTAGTGGFAGSSEAAVQLYASPDDYINLGSWFNYQAFTLSLWVNPASSQNGNTDLIDNNHNSSANWVIEQNGGSVNQYVWWASDGTNITFNLSPNTWQHLAITRDATNVSRVYINGVLVGTAAGTAQVNYNGSQYLRLGRWGGGGRNWNGLLDEFRIWDRPLSQAEIIAGMTGHLTGNEPDLAGYWPFDEAFGTTSADLSPSNHPAAFVNGPGWVNLGPTNATPPGLWAQYILNFDLTNPTAPQITSVDLPANLTTNTGIISSFTVGFSEDMDAAFTVLNRNVLKYGGHSYFVTDSTMSWTSAEAVGVAVGGHLVAINDAAENSWVNQNFSQYGTLWLGGNDIAVEGNWVWTSGDPWSYSNWNSGEPNNGSGNEDGASMYTSGYWNDAPISTAYRGVIEVASTTDTDGDGLVDALDPYPTDPLNAFDLRAAGPDGVFDTADDVVYRINTTGYSSGLSGGFSIVDGPLQAGNYRFKVTTALRDRFGVPMAAPYVRYFTIAPVSGFVEENRRAGGSSSTSLSVNATNVNDGSFASSVSYSTPANPHFMAGGYLNGDTNLDLVTCNLTGDNITVFLGDGQGKFQAVTNIPTGDGAISVAIADFNGDNKADLAVANYYANTVTILLGDGTGNFQVRTNYSGFRNPVNLAAADFNGDHKLDLVVPNYGSTNVTLLFGNGDGTFQVATNYAVGTAPQTVAIGDLNGDGQPDLAVANYSSSSISVLLGIPGGTFQPPVTYTNAGNTRFVALGNVNGDTNLDMVAVSGGTLNVFLGHGDGTFGTRADYSIGGSDPYKVALADINGDGMLDALVASYGANQLITVLNNGDGTFGPTFTYSPGGNPINVVPGDFNHDGVMDFATANYNGNSVTVWLGNNTEGLTLDPAGTGLRIGAGRGNLADSGDLDYWTFSAQSGDRLFIATENPGDPGSSGLLYRIYNPDWSQWTYFYSDSYGRGQISLTVPVSGTYAIRVEPNYGYYGEFRLRVTLAKAPVQLESEDNSSIGTANAVTFALTNGQRNATFLGYIGRADSSGDFYQLGNLPTGTQITLGLARPASSQLGAQIEIYNSSSVLVTNSLPGQTNLVYTVGAGGGGAYYAHVTWAYAGRNAAVSNYLSFNGNNNYVNVGNWAPGAKYSIQAWVMPTSYPGGRRAIAGGVGGCQDWALVYQDNRFGVDVRPGSCSTTYEASWSPTLGNWYHLAAVSDGTNAFLYINGVLSASGPVASDYAPYTGGTWIGGDVCCGEYFPGVIQNVSIWNRALSAAEVAAFMASSPVGSESGLLGCWSLQDGLGTTVPDLSTNAHNGTLINSPAWIALAPTGSVPSGIFQQYLLSLNLLNTIPPQIASVSLPAEGTISSNILDRFSIGFSEDMAPAPVNAGTNYEMRSAGPDNVFGTADDQFYAVGIASTYSSGTSASYLITDGPLQPGLYRFTIRTNLTDPAGTFLPAPYVRNFSVANVPGFAFESRANNSMASATPLSLIRSNRADGSFTGVATLGIGTRVRRIAAGQLNGDTNLDLVAAMWDSGSVAVLLGNGDGTFQVKTNYATGSQAWSVALGNFDADTNLDLAVVNYGANTVTVLTGKGDGTFQVRSNYNVGTTPYHIVVGDFNHDGKADLAVPNYGSGTVSILLGNGDGTFRPAVNYPAGNGPTGAAVGDVNGDGKPDLIIADYDGNNVSILFGNGDGTFAPAVTLAAGYNPIAVAFADLNNDGKPDLAVANWSDNTVSVMLGNGDGSFQPRRNVSVGNSSYEILATDLNGDGWRDLVVNGYYNNSVNVLLNQGDGTFQSPSTYGVGSHPVGLVAADFNNDGRPDLVVGTFDGDSISTFLGNDTEAPIPDPVTGLRISAGRGNLYNNSDVDYWTFNALAGDSLLITTENPGNPGSSGLLYRIYYPQGDQWTYFYTDSYGRGQASLTVAVSGTYSVRPEVYYGYYGEYRVRVTLARPPVQVESEANDSISTADALSFAFSAGHRQASVLGCISSGDGSDIFQLGTLAPGAAINLSLTEPANSGLLAGLVVYNSSGGLIGYSSAGAASLACTVPPGAGGACYAQVYDAGPAVAPRIGGVDGYALRFAGSSDWISITNSNPVIPTSGDFTVECWAYAYGSSSYREIISQGNQFYLGTDGSNIRSGDSWQNTGVAFPFGGWHHFAIVKSSTNTLVFVDGALAASRGSAIPNPGAADFRIGRQYSSYSEYWWGAIDEVRVWNVARAAADLQQNMTNRLTGSESGLVGYWRFDEGTGTVVNDRSAAGNTGLFQGYPVWLPSTRTNVQPSSIFSQYVLGIDLLDTTPAAVTSVTLPAAASTNMSIFDRFTLGFSKNLDPTALNALNRSLRLYNGHAYTLTDSSATWYNAELQARALGGHLATINDAAENAWLQTNFNGYANYWIGFTDEAQKGTFLWASGEPIAYTNWSGGGGPDYSGNKDYTYMQANGTWANNTINSNYRGLIEVGGPDSDGDGIPDAIDPYPNDPYNLIDLRATGPDGLFDTADDQIYHVSFSAYSSGLSLDLSIADGPLQPGYYRFMVTSSLRDVAGNTMAAPFAQYFTVADVPGYVIEGRTNNSATAATPLPLTEDPPGMKTAGARGNLSNNSQVDYWSFAGTNGDLFNLATYNPGSPSGSQLRFLVYNPDGSVLSDYYPSYYGDGQGPAYTLPATGTYLVRVAINYGYNGEYRFRITTATPPLQMESEDNGSLANANVLTFTTTTNARSASVVGNIRTIADLDYFNLGTVSNGYSIFLNVRQPGSSALIPVVSVYNAANVYQAEGVGGRPSDGVANVPITATGTYYAVVRTANTTADLKDQYILDVQVVPTGSINFPNLIVTAANPPSASGILSGQTITYSYAVANLGNVPTPAGDWIDRAVLSTDQILGNGDDIPLGFFPHSGILNPTDSYTQTKSFPLPDGISGDFYLIVQADAGNAINEYLFEGDNVTVSSSTFHVDVAPYPDLTVEGLNVAGPDSGGTYTITWNTANRGNAAAPAGAYERFLVRNQTTGTLLASLEPTLGSLAVNAVLPHTQTVTTTNAGVYLVQVVTDSRNNLFEYNPSGHAAAEANNTASTNFQIVAYFNVSLQSSPPGAGSLAGAGTFASGSPVTVTATPNTSVLPYSFVNWTEGGTFQSASSNYTFFISRDRTLTANFTLPTFLIAASNNPPSGGTVSGQGSYFYGTTNVLTANANSGYLFTNWTENGLLLGGTPYFTIIVRSNRTVVANYIEANTKHVVTTGTSPTNIATVAGAGTYTNGQTASLSAPLSVTNPPNIYNFRQFQLNGTPDSTNASFTKTFSTLDPTNLQYIAFYDTVSILPLVTNVVVNYPTLVPATTNFQISFQFNRGMNTNFTPLVVLTNPAASLQAVVPAGGTWSRTAVSNDTFMPPAITFATGMDGTNSVWVSQARDLNGGQLALTNVLTFRVDVTPPTNPALTLTASNSSTATVSWTGYPFPADLSSFRVYLALSNYTSVSGLTAVSSLGSSARSFTYSSLSLDRPYYAAVVAVDNAGNSSPLVTPLMFSLPSSLPPPVVVQVSAVGASSALVSWNGYDTSALLGFAGFQLYYETTNFTSVTGHAVRQTLGTGARSVQVDNLDRTRTYYFAMVGYNGNNGFNPTVTTATWRDPYAGNITANLTIGGAGQGTVDILQNITVANNAVVTVPIGTTLRFAAGTGLTIQQGALVANGTPLDPIIFTSANDQAGHSPAPGDWKGLFLANGAGASVLRNVFVNYGAGLTISNCAPIVDAFSALNNLGAGLTVQNSAVLNTTNALLAYNGIGAQLSAAQLTLFNSSIKNNGTNALGAGATLHASGNWWGSATAADIDALLRGTVDRTGFLTSEPCLTPAIGTLNNVTQVGSPSVNLRLACRTADAMRLSEDSTFYGVFFAPFTNNAAFPLSSSGGLKTVFAQFRSLTGQTSAPVAVTVTYITAGPTIYAFNLSEGQVLNRPLVVTGSASAPLGMASMEFDVDNVAQVTSPGGSLSQWFDVRGFSSAIHRVRLLARDNSGNIATLEHNVTISPTPPPAPLITQPAADLTISSNTLNVAGTAEPYLGVRLLRNGSVAGTTTASAIGQFSFAAVALAEGPNALVALGYDSLGSAGSPSVNVVVDTGPPAAPVMDTFAYTPGSGLQVAWKYAATGEHPVNFRLFWHTAPFTSTSQATGQSPLLTALNYNVSGLPQGTYYFGVVGYDAAGNPSALSTLASYNYDPLPPSFTIAFDKSSPVGVGPLRITIVASKPLAATPGLTLLPYQSSPVSLTISNVALNTFQGTLLVSAATPSGPMGFTVGGRDLAGNVFTGPPVGPALAIDVTPPSGIISTVPVAPVQVTNPVSAALSLTLSEAPKPGSAPQLAFNPPTGSAVPVNLTGAGVNWSGPLNLVPAMGSGSGTFSLTVTDALENIGHLITSGAALEIYNTALPTAPAQPVHFEATSLSNGRVQLVWDAIANAEIYRVYSETGTSFTLPTVLIADSIVSNSFIDRPSVDGSYRYAVTAARRGAEGVPSIVRVAVSDRTPPPVPVGVNAQLLAAGVQITWAAGTGETPDHFNVYRNGSLIRTVTGVTPVTDSPPRGVMNYTVGAVDHLGNEALSAPATIELLVSAVNSFQALVSGGQAPLLSWVSTDPTAVGFNLYRNGIKQNSTPLAGSSYTDALGIPPQGAVTYIVRAVNSTNAESAPRTVQVFSIGLGLAANLSGGAQQALVTHWFDDFHVSVSNLTAGLAFPLDNVQLQRAIPTESTLTLGSSVGAAVAAGADFEGDIVFPSAVSLNPQAIRLRAYQQADLGGSFAIYEQSAAFSSVVTPAPQLDISANQQPLAGGLAAFTVTVHNQGYANMDFVVVRGNGSDPGDLYISVKNQLGQEVSRTQYKGTPSGTIFSGDGRGFLRLAPGASQSFSFSGVLVPDALGTSATTFEVGLPNVYYHLGSADQLASGPLVGSTVSTLAQTPYYGVAQTDRMIYANGDPILITGFALDRQTGLPVPKVPLSLGFAMRGARFYNSVTSDISGAFSFTYTPPAGLSGAMNIWAAHPAVVDVLNQAQVLIYSLFVSPAHADVRLSKNDKLQFALTLINPGDLPLSGFTFAPQIYRMEGTNSIPVSNITATALLAPGFGLGGHENKSVTFELTAALDAPDSAVLQGTLRSAEGAAATFQANLTLMQANPLLVVVDPPAGYVDVSLDRGSLLSRTVTVVNRGLRDLQGVTMQPPTNVAWMAVNAQIGSDGRIHLPDLVVGASNMFSVVFSPPATAPLTNFQDQVVFTGTNTPAAFPVNVYALVTSSQKGNVHFLVDDILEESVPNATVRIKNAILQQELTATTDANGEATVTNLQEGQWAWQVTAPGYSSTVGNIDVVPNQTAPVETRLARSLVTVTFTVTPVPFTDRYEITIEQTFETHVPVPVLVLTPPYVQFSGVTAGFDVTYIANIKNWGLVQATDLSIVGGYSVNASLTPLIEYFPVLRAMESVDVPVRFHYDGGITSTVTNGCTGGIYDVHQGGGILTLAAYAIASSADQVTTWNLSASETVNYTEPTSLWDPLHGIDLVQQINYCQYSGGGGGSFGGGGGGGGGGGSGPSRPVTPSYQQSSPPCFVAGTPILLANGEFKPVESIGTNDLVRTGLEPNAVSRVGEVLAREVNEIYEIGYATAAPAVVSLAHSARTVQASPEHRFWVDGQGWESARNLKPGQWLFNSDGLRVQVLSVTPRTGKTRVYTFSNRDDHAFYADGLLVRDSCGDKSPYLRLDGGVGGPARLLNRGRAPDSPPAAPRKEVRP